MQDPISWRKRFSLIGRRTLIAEGQFNAARPRRNPWMCMLRPFNWTNARYNSAFSSKRFEMK